MFILLEARFRMEKGMRGHVSKSWPWKLQFSGTGISI